MTILPGFKAVPVSGDVVSRIDQSASARWAKNIAEGVNRLLAGKMNVVLQVTLAVNASTTSVIDARIGVYSALILQPLTYNAAIALYETPFVFVSNQKNGSVTLNHAVNAAADKTFNLVILG